MVSFYFFLRGSRIEEREADPGLEDYIDVDAPFETAPEEIFNVSEFFSERNLKTIMDNAVHDFMQGFSSQQ